jgi:cytochrome c oxidase subunit II
MRHAGAWARGGGMAAYFSSMPAWPISFQSVLEPSGVQAARILDLWWLTLAVCTAVYVALMIAFAYALWRAPRVPLDAAPDLEARRGGEGAATRAVIAAVAVSAVLLCGLIAASFFTDRALARTAADGAVKIELTAHQWWWEARYGDSEPARMFSAANELTIPVGRPVEITLKASDVIHSFWVPNLHGKKDLIPGRTDTLLVRTDQEGVYRGQCAEFCGVQHARMALVFSAVAPEAYEQWAEQQRASAPEPADDTRGRGREVFLTRTCAMCHAILGTPANGRTGPDLTHVASRRTLAAGTLPNTRAQLRAWIVDPQRFKPGVNMPANPLTAEELEALLDYLETLR